MIVRDKCASKLLIGTLVLTSNMFVQPRSFVQTHHEPTQSNPACKCMKHFLDMQHIISIYVHNFV
jgi:hypothetical protein